MILNKLYFLGILLLVAKGYTQTPKDFCKQYEDQHDTIQSIDRKLQFCHEMLSKVDPECKVKLYLHLGQFYGLKREIDSSLYSYDQAIKTGESLKAEELLTVAYVHKAYRIAYNYNNSRNKEVTNLLEKARKILEKDSMNQSWSQYYNTYSKIEEENMQLQESLKYLDSAIIVNKRIGNTSRLSTSYHNRGVGFLNVSNYESSSRDLLHAIKLEEERDKPNLSQIASSCYILGGCYMQGGQQYEIAKKYIKKGIKISKEIGADYLELLNYSLLSECHQNLNENEEAINAADSSLVLARKLQDKLEIAQALRDKGWVYLDNLKDLNKAEQYFLESYKITLSSNNYDETHIAPSLQGLIDVYFEKKEYRAVEKYLIQFENVANKLGRQSHQKEVHRLYSQYYEKTRQPIKALDHFKKYNIIRDSISNSEVKTKIAELEKQYDTQKKELKIAELDKEKKAQELLTQKAKTKQNLFLVLAIVLGGLFLIGIWVYNKLKKQRNELAIAHNKLSEIDGVKNRLFSIIAHDLRGMLVPFQRAGKVLNYHVEKENYDKVKSLSNDLQSNSQGLSNMLDNLLNWSLEQMDGYTFKAESFSLVEAFEAIISNFEQHAKEKSTKVTLEYKQDHSIMFDKGAFHVIFRNLLSNALKYTEDGSVKITFNKDHSVLKCSVIDTGVGMDNVQQDQLFRLEKNNSTQGTQGEKGTGLGLNLVYRFVSMHKGKISVSSKLRLGTRFDLSFPLLESAKDVEDRDNPISA